MNNREFIVDELLGDIVMMDKAQIDNYFHDVKAIKNDIKSAEEKIRVA